MTDPNPYPKTDYGRNINSPDVLIIGAGISGLCTAIDLIKSGQGRNFVIVEKGTQVGGTWNDNVYPGCCCDVLSHLYSYSFEPNCNWTREYPGQEEIQDYLISVATKYSLYAHIRFSSSVVESRWDSSTSTWRTIIRRHGQESEIGEFYTVNSSFLVSAVGQLNSPKYPNIPGLDKFEGKTQHSARWDWDYEIRGKRVAIIGTGATAAQIIPEIADQVKSLTVLQRTPAWVMPRHDKPIPPIRRATYRYIPLVRRRYRSGLMDFREGVFDAAYNPSSVRHASIGAISRQHMMTQLPSCASTKLRAALTPDYPFSCKRIIVSDDFYPALLRSNVSLETSSISHVTPTGIQMKSGRHLDLDMIILATGFKTTQFLYPIRIIGSNGVSLSDTWAFNGASAYLGMTVPDMPNFAMLYGPNTNLAHNSLILQIEAQSLYITCLIRHVLAPRRQCRSQTSPSQSLTLQPKREVVENYNSVIQAKLATSTFADPRCTSWFKDEKGHITTNWCGSAVDYQKRTSYIDWEDFDIWDGGGQKVDRKGQTRWRRRVEETRIGDRMLITMGLGVLLLCVVVGSFRWSVSIAWMWGG